MSFGPRSRTFQLAAVLIITLVALGGDIFVLQTENSQIDQNNSAVSSQITSLQGSLNALQTSIAKLQTQLTQSQGALSAQAQQVAAIKGSLGSVQSQLANVTNEFNSNRSSDLIFQGQIYSQLQTIDVTLKSLTDRLNALTPQVPISTLVVIGDNYSSATDTFNFKVQNMLNSTVYAQISAVLFGTTSAENCGGVAGSYISQMYKFPPESVTVTQLSLSSGLYNGCAGNPVTSLHMYYMVAQSTAVSLTYIFNIVPGYNHP
jgi:hypothetical protein